MLNTLTIKFLQLQKTLLISVRMCVKIITRRGSDISCNKAFYEDHFYKPLIGCH